MYKAVRILLGVFIYLYSLNTVHAQDIHHSQFYTTHLNYNAAATGLFNGDQRLCLNYRRQWFIDDIVRYMTISGSYDFKIYPKSWKTKGMWNIGIQFNYDQAGDSKLGLAYLGLSTAYTYPINNHHIVSLGAGLSFAHRRFKPDELTWDAQWNGDIFDPTLPTGENFGNTSNNFFDANAGFNYRWQKSKRTRLDVGVSAFHLTKPEQKFFDQSLNIKLPIRWSFQLMPSIQITNAFDLLLHGLYQKQQAYEETLLGGYLKIYLNQRRGQELNVLLGMASRLNDALIPKIAVQYNNYYGGISYDLTNSEFESAVRQKGGPEFTFVYIFTKARPFAQLKSCPIF
ncbi:MAG: PorP/SprF family type IX secretion system membrane protein [Saprospiraceae bacterium]|nr:PorP/SprF family type IX secretion system membrane protein [Saprospiraceae bacterium]